MAPISLFATGYRFSDENEVDGLFRHDFGG
jgi:hypothetical protein